jgi:formiminotetrahydrofolate cyclodeaminase
VTDVADLTVREYLDQLAATSAVPGGGSAAAVSGAMGTALLSMVVKLSERRVQGATREELTAFLPRLNELYLELTHLGQDDIDAFRAVMAARKLEANVPGRRERLTGALLDATRVPLATAQAARQALELAERIEALAWPAVASDVITARHLLVTALEGGMANVRINLPELDGPVRQPLEKELADVAAFAAAARARPRI